MTLANRHVTGDLRRQPPPQRTEAVNLLHLILDLCYPRRCVLCGAVDQWPPRWPQGPRVGGLRRWDLPHLCWGCCRNLRRPVAPRRRLGAQRIGPPLFGGARTAGELVQVLAELKYRGVRGLAWPLAELVVDALLTAQAQGVAFDALVAVPLHRARQRARGFNQAAILAQLAAAQLAVPYLAELVRRHRPTAQQAPLAAAAPARSANVRGAFTAAAAGCGPSPRLAVVDDLITSGATLFAVADALETAGWRVTLGAAAGLALTDGEVTHPDLDTERPRS